MRQNIKKRIFLLKKKKLKFSTKKLIFYSLYIYKKNFFSIFLIFLFYYTLNRWLIVLVQNYTSIYDSFDQFSISLQSAKNIQDFINMNLRFYRNLFYHPNFIFYCLLLLIIEISLFPLLIGIYQVCYNSVKNKKIKLQSFFIGYQGYNFFRFMSLVLLYVLLKILFLCLFLFPFILFFIFSIIAAPLMLFNKLSSWEALTISYQIIKHYFWEVFLFLILITLICISGFLLCFFGIFITIPIFYISIYVLYEKFINSNLD